MSYKAGEFYLTSYGRKVEIVGVDEISDFPGLTDGNIEVVAYRFTDGSGEVYIRIAAGVSFRPVNEVRVGDKIEYLDETRVDPDMQRKVTYVSDELVVYRVTGPNLEDREYATRTDIFFNAFEVVE